MAPPNCALWSGLTGWANAPGDRASFKDRVKEEPQTAVKPTIFFLPKRVTVEFDRAYCALLPIPGLPRCALGLTGRRLWVLPVQNCKVSRSGEVPSGCGSLETASCMQIC